jgi:predicted chitinase
MEIPMSQLITASQLKAIAGAGARSDMVAAIVRGWPAAVQKAKLTTKLRASHFLAQIMTETGGFQILEESGAYKAPRIMEIFGVGHHSAAITAAEAKRIAALPVAQRGPVLFNRVYGTGNPRKMREFNNTGPNDGWLYRGGGMMQATGKSNYAAMEKKTGLPLVAHPELLHQPDSAFTAAYLEWIQDGRCNAAADRDDVTAVRRVINGGTNGLAECKTFLAKAKKALAGYGAAPVAALLDEPDAEPEAEPAGAADAVDAAPAPAAGTDVADPILLSVQTDLKAMNFNPGIPSGLWGGMTAGAIAGFINDRPGLPGPAPASMDDYRAIEPQLLAEIARAKSEVPPFTRPVTAARKAGDAATVATVAPEVVPVKRNFLLSAWTAIGTFLYGIYTTVSDTVSQAWDFFTDHKDSIPTDSGFLHSAWEWVVGLPPIVWAIAAAGLFGIIAMNSRSGVNKITESVSTGARQ